MATPKREARESIKKTEVEASAWFKKGMLRLYAILMKFLFIESNSLESITQIEVQASTWFRRGILSLDVMLMYLFVMSLLGIEKFSMSSLAFISLCLAAAFCLKQWQFIPFVILRGLLFALVLFATKNNNAMVFVFFSLWVFTMFCFEQWHIKCIPLKQFHESTKNRIALIDIIDNHKSYAIYLHDFLKDGDLGLNASDYILRFLPTLLGAPVGGLSLRTLNPLEAGVLRDISKLIPVFCLLNIHDVTTNAIAKRIHCSNSNWFDELKALGKDARVFLFSVDKMTERIWQEVEWVLKLQSGRQVIIVAPKEVLSMIERAYGPSNRMFLVEKKPGGSRAIAKRQYVTLPDDVMRSVKASLDVRETLVSDPIDLALYERHLREL
jgi:hypothetical protein